MKKVTEIVKESQLKENKNEILAFLLFMFSAYTTTVTLNVYSVWNFDILHHLLLQLLSAVFYLFFKLNGNQLRLKGPAKVDLIKENPEEEKVLKDNLEEETVLTDKPKESIITGRLNKAKENVKINKAPVHKYTPMIEELTTEFLNNVKTPIAHQPELWENIVSLTYPMELTVSRHKKLAHCYTMTTIFDNTPANVFDIFNSPSENGSSSGYIAVQEEIEIVDANTSIIYICTKSIWPTSARDLCVIKSSTVLKDGSIISVLKSAQHERRGKGYKDNVVRMEIYCAGTKFEKYGKNKCKLTIFFHGDPTGWIPKSLVTFIVSNVLPSQFEKTNKKVKGLSPKDKPSLILDYNQINKEEEEKEEKETINETENNKRGISIINKIDEEVKLPVKQENTNIQSIISNSNNASNLTTEPIIEEKITESIPPINIEIQSKEVNINPESSNIKLNSLPIITPSKPSIWERVKARFFSGSLLKRLLGTTTPLILITALFAILAKRNRITL